jgi:hypothetical protein
MDHSGPVTRQTSAFEMMISMARFMVATRRAFTDGRKVRRMSRPKVGADTERPSVVQFGCYLPPVVLAQQEKAWEADGALPRQLARG